MIRIGSGVSRVFVGFAIAGAVACGGDSAADDEDTGDDSSSAESMTIGPEESSSGDDPTTGASVDSSSSDTASPDSSSGESTAASESTDTGSSSGSESSTGEPEESSSTGEMLGSCPAGDLGPAVPDSLFGNTFGDSDDFSGSCGGAGSPDEEYVFTAPADGTYTFDTQDSTLDTVLYVLDGECMGTELACNDDGDGAQSVVQVDLVAGQTVTLVVDGTAPGGLPFELHVQSGSFACPTADIGSAVPNSVSGDSSMFFDGNAGSCGGQAGNDAEYLFTAPSTGAFLFDTIGSSIETYVYVQDGVCGGNELGCGPNGTIAYLEMGQQVTVVVDAVSGGGDFTLNVGTLVGACPDVDLGSDLPVSVMGNTADGDNTEDSTCGGTVTNDDLYLFTTTEAGLYRIQTIGSEADTIIFLLDGGCGGTEIACNDDATEGTTDSFLLQPLEAGQTVLVGVDGNDEGAYQLDIEFLACPAEDLGNTVPQSVDGTTVGYPDILSATNCMSDGDAPDYTFEFTAPDTASYTFDLGGSDYDTYLYVQDMACNGLELACNDDFIGLQSQVSVNLVQDQTVVIVVSGYSGNSGNFVLNIN